MRYATEFSLMKKKKIYLENAKVLELITSCLIRDKNWLKEYHVPHLVCPGLVVMDIEGSSLQSNC